jgi:hypothetical protein
MWKIDQFEVGPTILTVSDCEIIYLAKTQDLIVTIREITKSRYTELE